MAPYWTIKIEGVLKEVRCLLIMAQSIASLIFVVQFVLETSFDSKYFWIYSAELRDLDSNPSPSLVMYLHFLRDCLLMVHGIIVNLSCHHKGDLQQVKHLQFFRTVVLFKFTISQSLCLWNCLGQLYLHLPGMQIAYGLELFSARDYSDCRLSNQQMRSAAVGMLSLCRAKVSPCLYSQRLGDLWECLLYFFRCLHHKVCFWVHFWRDFFATSELK